MQIKILEPKQALSKAYLKRKPNRKEFDNFKEELARLIDLINPDESEEHNKHFVSNFLAKTFYQENFINTKGKIDLALFLGKEQKSKVGLIAEVKSPGEKTQMVARDNLNTKAMHQTILYYLRERIEEKNGDVKSIVITNGYEWFIFDARLYEKLFYKNAELVKEYKSWSTNKKVSSNTDHFYNEIAAKALSKISDEIEFVHFDILNYKKFYSKDDEGRLSPLFKIFSKPFLLKEQFSNDSNTLDKSFYNELLHIIGLEEVKEGSKRIIRRKGENEREPGAILENTIEKLKSKDTLTYFDSAKKFGDTDEERLFNIGLQLNITWINRILFLKLLEAQLINYHRDDSDYKFLSAKFISEYDDLEELFHEVLARKVSERTKSVKEKFTDIPYLNSSLFERSDLERSTLSISELKDRFELSIYSNTVLRDEADKKLHGNLSTLDYLLKFLDSYDFSSESTGEEIQEEGKSIINASVLGLIFEKINGYKEGSFFTPGFITMYMSRETIRRAIVQKFNDKLQTNYKDFSVLKSEIDRTKEGREKANDIINDLKVCDPAVGSGHFLVSALNEIITIKSELGILSYLDGSRVQNYSIEIDNDELIISDLESEDIFKYHLNEKGHIIGELQRLQETIFHEKQIIIENCLFGVDINPNSVNICRLRLWIELLKHSYYTEESNYQELETLPNIDINIKQGNSLISRFGLKDRVFTMGDKSIIDLYKINVELYKKTTDRKERKKLKDSIDKIRNRIKGIYEDPLRKEKKQLKTLNGELENLQTQISGFEDEKLEEKKEKLHKRIDLLASEIIKQEDENEVVFRDSFEWRFEFPEVLDEEGNFAGFDVIIGNPPYGIKLSNIVKKILDKFYRNSIDIYILFFERSVTLIKKNGFFSFITPTFWLTGDNYFITRKFILENAYLLIGVTLPYDIFNDAYIDTGIYIFSLDTKSAISSIFQFEPRNKIDLSVLNSIQFNILSKKEWIDSPGLKIVFNPVSRSLIKKINSFSTKVEGITLSARGILAKKDEYLIEKKNKKHEPVFVGKLDRYYYEKDIIKYIEYGNNLLEKPSSFEFFIGERILVRRIINRRFRIMATLVANKFVTKKDIYIFKANSDKINNHFLLGVFNSKLMSFLMTNSSNAAKKDDFTQLTLNDLRSIPIPIPTTSILNKMKDYIEEILEAKISNPEADAFLLEREIDQLVYKLYDLSKEEIKVVEESTK